MYDIGKQCAQVLALHRGERLVDESSLNCFSL